MPNALSATDALPDPPPPGTLQFFDGYFPALTAGNYQLKIRQIVSGPGTAPAYELDQAFTVQAPEFLLDQGIVQSLYPPAGAADTYGDTVPFIVLADPSLPWERSLTPGQDLPDPSSPTPWLALLVFAEGEIRLQPGSNEPVKACTVADLVASDPNVLKPQFPEGWLTADALASPCQTITVTGAAFVAVAPSPGELPFLAHCRAVRADGEGEALVSVLLANRLAVADTRPTSAQALRYYAHLVSLEGYADYLGPGATPVPARQDGSGPKDVCLVSLAAWSFVSLPEAGTSFSALVQGLIASQAATPTLRLPVPQPPTEVNASVAARLAQGYAPLTFVAGSGETSFAWYRGPLSPVLPQPLPQVGSPATDPRHATSADALMIYLAEEGLFDLSYAAAWNIGRELALADSRFARQVHLFRQTSHATLGRLTQRAGLRHLAGAVPLAAWAEAKPTRSHFASRIGEGLGRHWTGALDAAREGQRPAPHVAHRRARRRRMALHPREVLTLSGAAAAVREDVREILEQVAEWLADLSLLKPVPFSHLVPDPRMLPPESARFFYLDQGWIDAAVAGALSLAVHGSTDLALLAACGPALQEYIADQRVRRSGGALAVGEGDAAVTGLLIRSQLVSGWPDLVIAPSLGGAPLPVVRDDCPSDVVRLCLFKGVPDMVRLSEPYQGLRFGLEDGAIYPRCVTSGVSAGAQIGNVAPAAAPLRTAATGAVGGVLDVARLVPELESAAGVLPFASAAVVQWNGAPLTTTFVTARCLTAAVPASLVAQAGRAAITVLSGGALSAAVGLTIDPTLAVDGLAPSVVGAGSGALSLIVTGRGFGADAVASLNGTPLATRVVSVLEVTAEVPAATLITSGKAAVTVSSGGATSNAATLNIVGAAPGIDQLEPAVQPAGAPGFTLTIIGSGFGPDCVVQWNGRPLLSRIVKPGQTLAATVPASLIAQPGTALVAVIRGSEASQPATFTIASANPTLGSLQPAVALSGGTAALTLVIDGVNFAAGASAFWNSTALVTTVDDAEQVTATVPPALLASAGSVAVTVRSGAATSNALTFEVIAPRPSIGLLDPGIVVAGSAAFTLTATCGFGSADLALQLVKAPESQTFIPISRAVRSR